VNGLTIGTVAQQAGVNIETLRYYERKGIIPKPLRTSSNYRLYSKETVRRVRFVKRAQELGFSLREIKELLALRATRGAKCQDVRRQALYKIGEIEEKIQTLQAMQDALHRLVKECGSANVPVSDCPILESLGSNGTR
jgi:Hg(II)-responsive transcriptional regulator